MSDNKKFNIFKPICALLVATNIVQAKGTIDNTDKVTTLNADMSELTENYTKLSKSYSQLETEYKDLLDKQKEEEQSLSNTQPMQYAIEDMVVRTRTGKKYHRPTCRFVKDKPDTTTLSREDAERANLKPCDICNP